MKLWVAVVLVSSVAFAGPTSRGAGPKFAVHPLDARELSVEQREWLKAYADVRLARTPGIRLAGSTRLEDAVRSPKGRDCETNDACLVYLANATDSLYGVYARLQVDPATGAQRVTARVVRADGEQVRTVVKRAGPSADPLDASKRLVADAFDALDLRSLPEKPPVENGLEHLPPPPLLPVDRVSGGTPLPQISPRKKLGVLIGAVGLATLTTGTAVFLSAFETRQHLTFDEGGAVPSSQERLRRESAAQADVATVLVPTGALLTLTGVLVAFWPDPPVQISAGAGPRGGGVSFAGAF